MKPKPKLKPFLIRSLFLLLGCLLFSASLSFFLTPASLVTGGVSGVAILLAHYVPLGIGTLFLILNLPILLAGLVKFGKKFMISTVIATLLSSLFTELFTLLFDRFLPITEDRLLAAIFGGIACGAGLGFVFRAGATTGGTDIGVRLLRLRFPHFKTGILFFFIDFTVVLASVAVFGGLEAALYSTVALLVTSAVMDRVLYGRDKATLLFIISEKHQELAQRLLKESEVGVTYVESTGAYSEKKGKMLFCAVRSRLYPKVRNIITETDPAAFTVVASANEIYGEGFKAPSSDL